MTKISNITEIDRAKFAEVLQHLTLAILDRSGQGVPTIEVTWYPSADDIIANNIRLEFEALLKSIIFPSSHGSSDIPKERMSNE